MLMSYEIYYDRAYIRVGDRYIPMVSQGSSNCFTFNAFGREVPEKNWQMLNWQHREQLLFTAEELRAQADIYEENHQLNGMSFKTRNQPFAPGAFGRWIANGMKNAYTIEEYVRFGNMLYVHDYSDPTTSKWEKHYFRTTEEFLALLEQLKSCMELNVSFANSREVYRPVQHRPKTSAPDRSTLPEYYVLKFELGYFVKLMQRGFKYAYNNDPRSVRIFPTEAAAQKYLEQYRQRLGKPFEIERVVPRQNRRTA
jgi:hypothetical protein